jgi:pimeloyl-ACP methyl ester carboxylesterase
MTSSTVDVPGGSLHVVDEGVGPPILLLHAGIADLRAWDAMVAPLVAAGYRVIRYDARGYGRSTTEDVAFSPRADLLAVLDAVGAGRAALVGNSRGGALAYDAAIESPQRVVAVVGVAAGVGGFDGGETPEEQAIFEAYEAVDEAEPFDAVALTDFETAVWGDGPGQPVGRLRADARALLSEMNLPLNDPASVKGREIKLDPVANERLAELRCPVLAIGGALDFSNVTQSARHLEADAPDGRAVIWDDVAHMIGMEQPDRLAAAIVSFLEPLDRWT